MFWKLKYGCHIFISSTFHQPLASLFLTAAGVLNQQTTKSSKKPVNYYHNINKYNQQQ